MRWGMRLAMVGALACGDGPASGADGGTSGEPSSATDTSGLASSGTLEGSDGTTGSGPTPEVDWPHLSCDPLVETLCGLPFPNNVFTVASPSTPTGRRVALADEAAPVSVDGVQTQTFPFAHSDGFSTSAAILAHLPGATVTGLPSPADLGASIAPESPTILTDAESGERAPHFAELDTNAPADRRAFSIRPVVPLAAARRYIVAIRNVVDGGGTPLPATPAFAALRDGTASEDPDVETRRGLYADIFPRLEAAGVVRDELQLAWDFTTASDQNVTGWMLAIRDAALQIVGDDGPAYVIDDVATDPTPELMLRIEGTMTVPLFLDDPGPGGALILDEDEMPQQNGETDYPFTVLVPHSAAMEPAGIIHIGHGLLGSREQVGAGHYQAFAADHGYVLVATDWIGMAEDDVPHLFELLTSGELERFHTLTDRLHQGILNAVLAIRMLRGAFAADPILAGAMIDTTRVHYIGSSQGGILGGVLMAVSPDIQRGVLDVAGQPYNLLLERSVDFTPFLNLLHQEFDDPLELQLLLALAQMLWDRVEPAGYTKFIHDDPLPGTAAKDVLVQVAIGDHQVATMGAHIMARAIGAPNLTPANREVWGLPTAAGSSQGVGMIEYDFGLPPEPITNVPMEEGEDPHGEVRELPASVQTRAQFLETGLIETFCDGPCDPQ